VKEWEESEMRRQKPDGISMGRTLLFCCRFHKELNTVYRSSALKGGEARYNSSGWQWADGRLKG